MKLGAITISSVLSGFLGALSEVASAQVFDRPNVLLIIVDDLRPELGASGHALAHTPHIDALAAKGFVFENAFAPVPVCGASRAAMLSGRKPNQSFCVL